MKTDVVGGAGGLKLGKMEKRRNWKAQKGFTISHKMKKLHNHKKVNTSISHHVVQLQKVML